MKLCTIMTTSSLLFLAGQGTSFIPPKLGATANVHHPRHDHQWRHPLPMSTTSTKNKGSGFYSLSVTELKRLLTERGVDFRDCLEKRDLVERLEQSDPPSSSSTVEHLTTLSSEEQRIIQTFKRVSPCVAYIQTTAIVKQGGLSLKAMEIPLGSGSGFLWDSRGHVVTNYHVIAPKGGLPRGKVKVKLQGMADARDAEVVGVEPEKDLAVLRLTSLNNLPRPVDVGTSNDLQVGQSVLAIGNPFGLDDTLTTGIVSALGRDVDGIGGRPIKGCIQSDAPINPGNSGGPLLDSRGRLIGVNTAIFSTNGGGNVGIGFAIPVDTVRRVVNQIIRYGRVVRPTLGINVADDRLARNIFYQLGRELEGVLVVEVIPGSPAAQIGLKPTMRRTDGSVVLGDVITDVDGQPVRQVEDLLSAIEERNEGDNVELRVLRGGDPRQVETLTAKLSSRDSFQVHQGVRRGSNNVGFYP